MEMAKAAREVAAGPACDPAQGGEPMIYLNIGEPDFTASAPVQAAAQACLQAGQTAYTQATGLPALRSAISTWYAQRFGLDIAPERILVTAGASAALQLVCLALFEAGDEVLMPDPCYPCNRHFVTAASAALRARAALSARCRGGGGRLDAGHARRGAGLALQPHGHLHRPRRDGAHRRGGARARRRDGGR
jgi:aspartate/methionine/tyrosine aminotransferase